MLNLCWPSEPMQSRRSLEKRGSLVAVVTADVSRAEFSRMFSKGMLDLQQVSDSMERT